jgi:hypothetical protein
MQIIETPEFTKRIISLLPDDEYNKFQQYLISVRPKTPFEGIENLVDAGAHVPEKPLPSICGGPGIQNVYK